MHELAVIEDVDIQGREGEWTRVARGNQVVTIAWQADATGVRAEGTVTGQHPRVQHPFTLSVEHADADARTLVLGDIDVTLTLTRLVRPESTEPPVALICNLPLTESSFFNRAIALWHAAPPQPVPVPDDDPEAPAPGELEIQGPQNAVDLFPFVWLHPPGRRELAGMALHFITVTACGLALDKLPLYQQLAGETTLDAKRKDAVSFRESGSGDARFVASLASLPAPMNGFPAWRAALERQHRTLLPEELHEMAFMLLDRRTEKFLADPTMQAQLADVWQTLFALALAGTPADATLAVQLTDVLRVWHFLALLAAGRDEELGQPDLRRAVLDARAVFPDEVAAFPPAPAIAGPQPPGTSGNWEVLGVGTLKAARQQLLAYLPGELAEVVNVMPRERQEVQARTTTRVEERAGDKAESDTRDHLTRQTLATSELSEAVQEAMAADGMLANLQNVEPAYNNLNLMLSGASANGQADSKWTGHDTSRFMRKVTEQAARRLGERISRQRGAVWHELRERRESTVIDNADNGRLVGLYRWVDQLMQVHVEERGRRLVLSFLVAAPAQGWLAEVSGKGALPLQEPQPLDAFKVPLGQGYTAITPANYQASGAQYGLCDMEAPPRHSLTLCASYDQVGAAEANGLMIPDGYAAVSGQVTIGLADNRYNLQCSVAGQVYTSQGTAASQIVLDTAVPAPATAGTSIGDAIVKPPALPAAIMASQALAQIAGAQGKVPVSVATAAPSFVVQLDVLCQRSDDSSDPGYVAWQVRTYARLLRAYEDACAAYARQMGARIEAASAGRTAEVQRNALRQACLDLLAPGGREHPDQFRALAPTLSWDAMTWQYEPWPVGQASPWPEPAPAESTEPSSQRLFRQFLRAPSARVLVPVAPGSEEWLLFYLQYGTPWAGGPATTPVTSSCTLLLEEVRAPERVLVCTASGERASMPALLATGQRKHWTVRVPTSLLYLQAEATLPRFGRGKPTHHPQASGA